MDVPTLLSPTKTTVHDQKRCCRLLLTNMRTCTRGSSNRRRLSAASTFSRVHIHIDTYATLTRQSITTVDELLPPRASVRRGDDVHQRALLQHPKSDGRGRRDPSTTARPTTTNTSSTTATSATGSDNGSGCGREVAIATVNIVERCRRRGRRCRL